MVDTEIAKVQDALLGEAAASWLIDAFDTAFAHLDTVGNNIVADADFGAIGFTGTPTSADVKDRIT